jgi:glycosyltransferase involved in cell wall biosynthesis
MTTLQINYSWAPFSEQVGGIESFLNQFVPYACAQWDGGVRVCGLGSSSDAFPPPLAGKCDFEVVLPTSNGVLPVNARFILAQWRKAEVKPSEAKVVFLNRTDHVWPYLGRTSPRIVLYVHGSVEYLGRPNESKLRFLRPIMPRLERLGVARSSRVIFVNQEGREYYEKRYPQYASRFFVIPSAIDVDHFRLLDTARCREALGVSPDTFLVLFVGRLETVKDPFLWANAFLRMVHGNHNVRAVILGNGTLRSEFLRLLACYQLSDHVLFAGPVARSELPRWYNAADVVLLTSHFEGSPRVVVEALACGTPVVTTNVGDVAEHLNHEVPLRICSTRDPFELASAAMGFQGHERKSCLPFASQHSQERLFEMLLDHLKQVAAESSDCHARR